MRRHELDPVSLVFGFAFAAVGLVFLLGDADQALRLRWIWPLLLLGLGAGILFDLARSNRRPEPDPALTDRDADRDPLPSDREDDLDLAPDSDAAPSEQDAPPPRTG
jgi:hypothetical protein